MAPIISTHEDFVKKNKNLSMEILTESPHLLPAMLILFIPKNQLFIPFLWIYLFENLRNG